MTKFERRLSVLAQIQEVDVENSGTTGRISSINPSTNGFIGMGSSDRGGALIISNGAKVPNIVLAANASNKALIAVSDGSIPRVAFGTDEKGIAALSMLGADGAPDMLAVNSKDGKYWFYSESRPAQRLWNGLSSISTLKSIFDLMRRR